MSKEAQPPKGRRKSPIVTDSRGARQRFLRGMITHDLVKRGLEFEDAFAIARGVRDAVADREEVTTVELRALVTAALATRYGADLPAGLRGPRQPVAALRVLYAGQEQPFSKAVLAGSIYAAGVEREVAYRLAARLERELLAEGVAEIPSGDVVRRVDDALEREVGSAATRRYRLVRRIHRLPRPLIVYLGGASGTGKSSLALELAPLLRIYRVNATDTIRQVMRMVFTPAILPALHRSTFDEAPSTETPGLDDLTEDRSERNERQIANFDEQSSRVCVGVRAVVERAIAENLSVIVEGVHLRPGLVPFPDLEGAAYQVPILLGTLDPEAHRTRFLTRMPAGERRAARYLESFDAIRAIHDHLLYLAETHEVPLLDTFADDDGALHAMRMITAVLERRVPALAQPDWVVTRTGIPTLMLIIDGVTDRPVRALGGRTPLQAARTPNLDRLAAEGQVGLCDPIAPGVVPDTAAGTLALFGQSPQALKRGPVEALGAGFKLAPGDVALRANLATIDDNGIVVDRRAGRIRDEVADLAKALDRLPLPGDLGSSVEVRVRPATEHRLAIVLRGEGLSAAIAGSDPGEGAELSPALTPRPLEPNNAAAVLTSRAVSAFEQAARKVLAKHPVNRRRAQRGLPVANTILTRGAGRIHRLITLEEAGLPLRIACISGDRTVIGLAHLIGAKTITRPEMTANLDTDLAGKFKAALRALEQHDLTMMHVKGADIAAHDRRPELKVEFIERVDRELGRLLEQRGGKPMRIAVASDHATLSESGQHAADPLPVLIWGPGIEVDDVRTFDEQAAANGSLQRFPLQMLIGRLFELS